MSFSFDPLQWPPNLSLAELHSQCNEPGLDNSEGAVCPCCNNTQKLENFRWARRYIQTDLSTPKCSIRAYFEVLRYLGFCIGIISIAIVSFHIYILEKACPILAGTERQCTSLWAFLIFCDSQILIETLMANNYETLANMFIYLQLSTYLLLVIATLGIKIMIKHVRFSRKIKCQEGTNGLIVRNVPIGFGQVDIKQKLDASVEIEEIFFVENAKKMEEYHYTLLDLYFQIKFYQDRVQVINDLKDKVTLKELSNKFSTLYEELKKQDQTQINEFKTAIVTFKKAQPKKMQPLQLNSMQKLLYSTLSMTGCPYLQLYSEPLPHKTQITWPNISSCPFQSRSRPILFTILIGLLCCGLGYLCYYFPTIYISPDTKLDRPGSNSVIYLVMMLLVLVISLMFKDFLLKMMPRMKMSSKMQQLSFIIATLILFHFAFYLITPIIYYLVHNQIAYNVKLKQFFISVCVFAATTVIIVWVDMRYKHWHKNKKQLIIDQKDAKKYCQNTLHEKLTVPQFPIELKMALLFNVWAFATFYVYQLPYLLFLLMITLLKLFWIDKRAFYKHYQRNTSLTLDAFIRIEKYYSIVFLVFISFGYSIATYFVLERYILIGFCALSIVCSLLLDRYVVEKSDSKVQNVNLSYLQNENNNTTLKDQILQTSEPKAKSEKMKNEDNSYRNSYENYLKQITNPLILQQFQEKYEQISQCNDTQHENAAPRRETELAKIGLIANDSHHEQIIA